MKKTLSIALACLLAGTGLGAQEATRTLASGHYDITCPEGLAGIESLADGLNGLWSMFNALFGFDPDQAKHRLKVTVLADKASFDAYVNARIGETRNQHILLRYPRPELSELVLYPAQALSGFEAFQGPSLNRQAFLQYLYSFALEPPVWVRDGFQAYFETATRDQATGSFSVKGVSPWLEQAKNLRADQARFIGSEELLSAITGSRESAVLYPQAWSLVSFLLSSGREEHRRFLHEAFMLLEDAEGVNGRTQKENTDAVKYRFARFNDFARTDEELTLWLKGLKTFNELVQEGVSDYNAGRYATSRKNLLLASDVKADDPIVLYYLGLVSYSEKDYPQAEKWYKAALAAGSDVSTTNWALGLNAYADKRYKDARQYIETARTVNPDRYGAKGETLLKSMPK
jgi:tetratricopeptide (TPR) repeat protein